MARPLKRWKLALARSFYPQADAVVAVSEGVAEDLRESARVGPERITTIYNPVVDKEVPEKARAPFKHPWF